MASTFSLDLELADGGVCLARLGGEAPFVGRAFVSALNDVLDRVALAPSARGFLLINEENADFIRGTDLADLGSLGGAAAVTEFAQSFQRVVGRIAELPMPTAVAIHGACFGPGIDLALAFDSRLASVDASTQLGSTDIGYGLIPYGGASHRLPRLIGLQSALDMVLTGRRLPALKALKNRLVDHCVPRNVLREEALRFLAGGREGDSTGDGTSKWTLEGNALGRKVLYLRAKDNVDLKTRGFYPASYKALDALAEGYDLDLATCCEREAAAFGQLFVTRQAQALIHLWSSRRARASSEDSPASPPSEDLSQGTVGVIGAGFIGAGISMASLEGGFRVRLRDRKPEAIGRTLRLLREGFSRKVDSRVLSPFEVRRIQQQVSPGCELRGLQHASIVIEAVHEDLTQKRGIVTAVERLLGPEAIYASNTAAIPISAIAAAAERPGRVVGMHFFAPVEQTRLVEIVRTPQTEESVLAGARQFCYAIGKRPIVVRDCPGFFSTRVLAAFLWEAIELAREGTPVLQIDAALREFGFPQGPFEFMDSIGVDTCLHVAQTMASSLPQADRVASVLGQVVDAGHLGVKNGRGFYRYDDGGQMMTVDERMAAILCPEPGEVPPDHELADRCLLIMVNDSIRLLEDEVIATPADGDLIAVWGLRFPPFWGGPFKYVDFVGATNVIERLATLSQRFGSRYQPADLLRKHAVEKRPFFATEAAAFQNAAKG